MLDPLSRPSWRGRTNVDALTIAAIEHAETFRRSPGTEFYITQGSYQGGGGDPLSAGTHDGGGVVDIRWAGDPQDILALRRAGFAAWHRTPSQGPWPDHVHAVLVGHPRLAGSAARQVDAYRAGRNGLANNGSDDGPRINPIPVFQMPQEDQMTPEQAKQLTDTLALVKETRDAIGGLRKKEAQRYKKTIIELRDQGRTDKDIVAALVALAAEDGA